MSNAAMESTEVSDIDSLLDLRYFYRPRSIAVVGAHDTRPALAGLTTKAMAQADKCGGTFIPVNPTKESVFGVRCRSSLAEVEGRIDVALIAVGDPIRIIDDATAAGADIGFYLVFSNEFSELGTREGVQREQDLLEAVRRSGARLIGPNTNANAWDPILDLPGGKVAVISQSGVQGRALTQAQELGIALSYWAPTGNEADLDATDFIRFFIAEGGSAAIAAYIEGFHSGPKLRQAAITAIEQEVPIVLVKVGRSEVGATMAASHTGHLVGADDAFEAFFEQFGINRVDDFDQLVQVSAAIARCPVPAADGVVVCSVSGGTAAHVSDLAQLDGLSIPKLTAETRRRLTDLIPAGFRIDNPVDNGGGVMLSGHGPDIWRACLDDPNIGIMFAPVPASAPGLTDAVGDTLLETAKTSSKPIFAIWSGPSTDHPVYRRLWEGGLPVFSNVRNAVAAAKALLNHPARNKALKEQAELAAVLPVIPASAPAGGERLLDEFEATSWLSARGVPFARSICAGSVDEAVEAAQAIGYPVVVKGRGISHKSERGMVATSIQDEPAVRAAGARMLADGATGLLVAEQLTGGLELIVGVTGDPVLGPVIVVGAGGVTAEAVRDVSRSVLPLTRDRAGKMLDQLRIAPLLDGWRNQPALDKAAVVDVLMTVAELAASDGIVELDINPLLVRSDGVHGLDALVRLAE